MIKSNRAAAIAMLAATTALTAAPAVAEDLVLPSEVAQTHWKTDYLTQFGDLVRERTNGEIDVKLFPAGQLYNEQDALAALGTGAVHMVWPVSVRVESIVPDTGVVSLPFALTDEMMTNECFGTGITQIMSSHVEPRGLKVLGMMRTSDLFFIFKDREVTKMEDLAGAKVRVTGGRVFLDTMQRLGVSPVSMSASEMSTAMSQGAIDGVFSSPAGWAEMIGLTGQYAWYVPGFQLSTYSIVVDGMWFDGLSPEHQQVIQTAIDEISAKEWVEAKAADEALIAKMQEQGATVHIADETEAARWRELGEEASAQFNEAHPEIVAQVDELEARCGFAS